VADEVTIPTLPCSSIDEIGDFYQILGFTVSHRQTRPNPYIVVRREDVELHFFGLPGFDPEQSYGLERQDDSTPVTDLVEALVYRVELAVALNDNDHADALLTQLLDMNLDDTERQRLRDALANADDLQRVLRGDRQP
jgi:hypothetical protein